MDNIQIIIDTLDNLQGLLRMDVLELIDTSIDGDCIVKSF